MSNLLNLSEEKGSYVGFLTNDRKPYTGGVVKGISVEQPHSVGSSPAVSKLERTTARRSHIIPRIWLSWVIRSSL